MFRLLTAGAAALVLLLSWSQAQADSVIMADHARYPVNVRENPSRSSTRIDRLRRGDEAELIRNLNRWREVRLEDGRTGFVSRRWTSVVRNLPERKTDEMRIHFLSVGAGTCTVVECPGSNANPLVYDCGSNDGRGGLALSETETKRKIASILDQHAAKPDIIASHGDRDHYSLMARVLDDIQARSVWMGGKSSSFDNFGFPTWIWRQEQGGATVHKDLGRHFHNDEEPLGNRLQCGLADVYILTNSSHDTNQGNDPDNADTLMLMIEYGDFSTIFSGDAEGETELQSIRNFGDTLKTTVLMGSHHGASSHRSNSSIWADATKPDVVVFSAGTKYGHPKCLATSRYRSHVKTVEPHSAICDINQRGTNDFVSTSAQYMTHTSGTIVVTTDGDSPLHLWCEGGRGCDTHIPF